MFFLTFVLEKTSTVLERNCHTKSLRRPCRIRLLGKENHLTFFLTSVLEKNCSSKQDVHDFAGFT